MTGGQASRSDGRAEQGSASYRRVLIALFAAGFATFMQMYSPQGLLPDIARDFDITVDQSSWAVGAATIGVAIGVLPWARLSDSIGRVRAMRWAMVCALLLGAAAPSVDNFGLFIAIRVAEGLAFAGLPALALTTLSETVAPRALGPAAGVYIAGTTFGGLTGRIVAVTAGEEFGWRIGIAAVVLIAAIATVVFLIAIPPTAIRMDAGLPIWQATVVNLRKPGVAVLVLQGFFMMGGFVAAYNYLAFRLVEEPFGLTLTQVSWLFLSYLSGAIASSAVWGLARRLSPTTVLLGCLALMLVGLAMTLTLSLVSVIVGLLLFTGGFFGAHSIASGLIGRRGGTSQAPALYNLGYYAGSSVVGWIGGFAFAAGGWGGAVAMISGAIVLTAALATGYARAHGGIQGVDRAE